VIVDHLVRRRVNYRDARSSLATDREEIEANAFGAALLMPEEWIQDRVDELLREGNSAARILEILASEFDVSKQAMENRLINLGLRAAP
jgi:Zn-dependent peptidase ImmA (M78 family)